MQEERSIYAAQEAGGLKAPSWRPGRWSLALALAGLAVVLLVTGPALWGEGIGLWALIQDPAALEAWVAGLGWLGPLVLVGLNALQIVVAPVPGYVVQLAAGFLFGPLWGGVWGTLGLLLGATLAFWLARVYGRPVAERLVGRARLDRWEKVTHSTSTLVWFVMLLGPTGDVPYFLAGLSQVSFVKVLAITAIIRIPSVFVAAAAGAGVMVFSWWQLALIFAGLAGIVWGFLRYQEQILDWTDRLLQRQLERSPGDDEAGESEQTKPV